MYNVITEPWVPVRLMDGKLTDVSLKEAITNAHCIQSVQHEDTIIECGVYIFLTTFVSDMLCRDCDESEDLIDIQQDLLTAGKFNSLRFDEYVDECNADGERFDLFDDKKPFMQNAEFEYGEKTFSIEKINKMGSSGERKTFRTNVLEKDVSYTPKQVTQMLVASPSFVVPEGGGYCSSHYGPMLPLYTFVDGNNLFEVIVKNLFVNAHRSRECNKPCWRMDATTNKKEDAPSMSTYALTMFPWRFVKVLVDDDGMVRNTKYSQGFRHRAETGITVKHPFISYVAGKKGDRAIISMKPELMWKNISHVIDRTSSPDVLKNNYESRYEYDTGEIQVFSYMTVSKNTHGTILGTWKSKFRIPTDMEKCVDVMDEAVKYAEDKLKKMNHSAKDVLGKQKVPSQMASEFYSICNSIYLSTFIPSVFGGEAEEAQFKWKSDILRNAMNVYNKYVTSKLSKMDMIIDAQKGVGRIIGKDAEYLKANKGVGM